MCVQCLCCWKVSRLCEADPVSCPVSHKSHIPLSCHRLVFSTWDRNKSQGEENATCICMAFWLTTFKLLDSDWQWRMLRGAFSGPLSCGSCGECDNFVYAVENKARKITSWLQLLLGWHQDLMLVFPPCLLLHLFTNSIANGKIVISSLWEWCLVSNVPSIAEEWARFAGPHQNVCLQLLLFCAIPQFMNYSKWIINHIEWLLSQQSCQVTGCVSPCSIPW